MLNNTTKTKKKPVRREDGRVVGYVSNSTLIKHVRESKHQLHYPPGWAIDIYTLKQAVKLKARKILLIDKETGNKYLVSMSEFKSNSFLIDRGHGKQRVLLLPSWKVQYPE